MAKTDILDYLQNINYKVLIGFMIIFSVIAMEATLVAPIEVHSDVKTFYDYVDAIPAGSVFLFDCSGNIANRVTILTATRGHGPLLLHLFNKPGIKILIFSITAEGPVNWDLFTRVVDSSFPGLLEKKKYGTDYVYLGYIAGAESAINAIGTNIRGVVSSDYYGTPLDSLPMMATGNPNTGGPINDASAFYAVNFGYWSAAGIQMYARQFGDSFHIPIIYPGVSAGEWGVSAPYYPKYIVRYFLGEMVAEYEALTKLYTLNYKLYATQHYFSAVFVALLVGVNVVWFISTRRKRVEAVVK